MRRLLALAAAAAATFLLLVAGLFVYGTFVAETHVAVNDHA